MDEYIGKICRNMAQNLATLRKARHMSQTDLASAAGIPRSTVTNLESGDSNPTLQNLARLSTALQVSIEELLASPRGRCTLITKEDVPARVRGTSGIVQHKLLPDKIPGMEIDRIVIPQGQRLRGVPHLRGTKEYMTCLTGQVTVFVSGDHFVVGAGDVLAFPGDQAHSYLSTGQGPAEFLSVVALAPAGM